MFILFRLVDNIVSLVFQCFGARLDTYHKIRILLSVAIDFGTAYSGYAFSTNADFEKDPTKIYANENWPAGKVGFSRKTPTVLLLNPKQEFEAFGFEAEDIYNELAVEKEHKKWYYFRQFKMCLHGEKVMKKDMTLEDETGKKLEAEKVFTESIKYLKNHFLKTVMKQGKQYEETEIQYILTVPAIWNDTAKQFMRNAAEKAGIAGAQLKIALEPEAAAFFCQYERTERNENMFAAANTGTKYMVIDLGGGTVDITLHKKLEHGRIQELYQATGGPYGGKVIDEVFIQLLIRCFGCPMINQFRSKYTYDFLDMMREFEVAKRNLKISGRSSMIIRLPVSFLQCCKKHYHVPISKVVSADKFPLKGEVEVISSKLSVKIGVMAEIFMSVTSKITDIIQEVLSSPVAEGCRILLLVGGFAESELVQIAIKERFEAKERRVIVPAESGLAILKGATIFGHRDSGIVTERVIRYTYGIATREDFDSTLHNPNFKMNIKGKDKIDLFSPFMNKGTAVKVGMIIHKTYFYDAFLPGSSIMVYSTTHNVRYMKEDGLEEILQIRIDEDVEEFYGQRVDIVVSYTFGDTELKISVLCVQNGKTFRANVANYS